MVRLIVQGIISFLALWGPSAALTALEHRTSGFGASAAVTFGGPVVVVIGGLLVRRRLSRVVGMLIVVSGMISLVYAGLITAYLFWIFRNV